jgi:hypothetical protein
MVTARKPEKNVANGQLEIVAVTGSMGKQGQKGTRKRTQKPANNRSLTL